MTAVEAAKRGIEPLAKIKSWATEGIDPAIMGAGPIQLARQLWKKPAGHPRTWTLLRPMKLLLRRHVQSPRKWAGTTKRSMLMEGPLRWATPSARRVREY